jgi:hypothetical protein
MRERRFKQILAVVLSLAMVLGMNSFAWAAPSTEFPIDSPPANVLVSGNAEETVSVGQTFGVGDLEGYVELNVFKVNLPVDSESNNNLRFKLDPQRLIYKTDAARYANIQGSEIDPNATLLFMSANEITGKYTNLSNVLSINNLSSVSVDVALKTRMVSADGLTLSSNGNFTDENDKTPKVYMAISINKGDKTGVTNVFDKAITATQLVSTNILEKVPLHSDDPLVRGYSVSWNESEAEQEGVPVSVNHGYYYKLDPDYEMGEAANTVLKFTFSGASNPYGDYKNLRNIAPKLEVIWDVKASGMAKVSKNVLTAADNSLTMNLPDGVTLTGATVTHADGTSPYALTNGRHYSISGTTLTVVSGEMTSWLAASPSYSKLVLTFSDGTTENVELR